MIMLLLLIPALCISISLYVMLLINFITSGNCDLILFITIFINIILSFFTIKIFIKSNSNIPFIMNLDNLSNSIHGYFSFIIMFLFGSSLILNSCFNKLNIFNLVIGILIFVSFIYITVEHIIKSKKEVLLLESVDEIEEYINCLNLIKEDTTYEFYVDKKIKYKENSKYLCKLNSNNKYIKKIIKEVIEID